MPVQSARRYIKITAGEPTIHKSVAQAVNGLRAFLEVERKRIPGNILVKRTGWSASFSLATILALMATSLLSYEAVFLSDHSTDVISLHFTTTRDKSSLQIAESSDTIGSF